MKETLSENSPEWKCYHVRIEKKCYDDRTGKRLSVPMLQKYGVKDWGSDPSNGVQDYLRAYGYEYTVLYDPRFESRKKNPVKGAVIDPEPASETETEVEQTETENAAPKPTVSLESKRGRKTKEN